MGVSFTMVRNDFPLLAARLEPRAENLAARMARQAADLARQRAPVKTGYLRSSIQSRHLGESEWEVTVGASYGVYVEYGTRKMAAQPFLTPAFQTIAQRFEAELATLLAD
jgi:HK97 gp10 family phage protein